MTEKATAEKSSPERAANAASGPAVRRLLPLPRAPESFKPKGGRAAALRP